MELGNPPDLQSLDLSSNRLSGSIPPELVNLTGLSTSGTDIGYNALWTNDPTLQAFLYSKDFDWDQTQTTAPSNIGIDSATLSSFTVSWTLIPYTADAGYYEVGPLAGMIFWDGFETGDTTIWGGTGGSVPLPTNYITIDKTDNSLLIDGLQPGVNYQFVIHTVTEAHALNENQVTSEESSVITATTSSR